MPRFGVVSDIHGNLHALQAVLADIDSHGVDEVICLGDVLGYGPDPGACLELVSSRCAYCVIGNHEEAVLRPSEAGRFNAQARAALEYTTNRLTPGQMAIVESMPCWASFGNDMICVHDAPTPVPGNGYVRTTGIASRVLATMGARLCLFGHTHVPAVFGLQDGAPEHRARRQVPFCGRSIRLAPDCRYLLNPGSVGQPRDGDWRASWALLDTEASAFTIHRVDYEVGRVQRAIDSVGLPSILGQRLRLGA